MAPLKEVQPLTGYIRGGVTVFGAKKPYPVFVDETIILFDKISVSAGARGTQLILSPDDYIRAAEAHIADLTKDQIPSHSHPERPGAKQGPRRATFARWGGERWGVKGPAFGSSGESAGEHEPGKSSPEGRKP
jgi:hypothetical protein